MSVEALLASNCVYVMMSRDGQWTIKADGQCVLKYAALPSSHMDAVQACVINVLLTRPQQVMHANVTSSGLQPSTPFLSIRC